MAVVAEGVQAVDEAGWEEMAEIQAARTAKVASATVMARGVDVEAVTVETVAAAMREGVAVLAKVKAVAASAVVVAVAGGTRQARATEA